MLRIPANIGEKAIFLVWGPPSYGPRSKVLTRELGLKKIHFVYSTMRRGYWAAPTKYTYQILATIKLLFRERPKLIFVQSPPSFAVLCAYGYCRLTQAHYIIDAHSAALQYWYWTRPEWLIRRLVRSALTTIVTNEHFQQKIQHLGGRAVILRDVPTSFDKNETYQMNGGFNIAVVNTFSDDEPLAEVLEASKSLPGVHFYVTGKKTQAPPTMIEQAPSNIHFTDYLPDPDYYALLNDAQAVLCLTTRNHTMQRGACEALSLGTPIITSDWPLLREYFNNGTVHVPNTSEGISQGVRQIMANYDFYQAGVRDLQITQEQEWEYRLGKLMTLIQETIGKQL